MKLKAFPVGMADVISIDRARLRTIIVLYRRLIPSNYYVTLVVERRLIRSSNFENLVDIRMVCCLF